MRWWHRTSLFSWWFICTHTLFHSLFFPRQSPKAAVATRLLSQFPLDFQICSLTGNEKSWREQTTLNKMTDIVFPVTPTVNTFASKHLRGFLSLRRCWRRENDSLLCLLGYTMFHERPFAKAKTALHFYYTILMSVTALCKHFCPKFEQIYLSKCQQVLCNR